jgi:hypothetical protein
MGDQQSLNEMRFEGMTRGVNLFHANETGALIV